MRQRLHALLGVVVLAVAVVLSPLVGAGQGGYVPPQTAWGDPDLRGHYLANYGGQLETPSGEKVDTVYPPHGQAFSRFFPLDRNDRPRRDRSRPQPPMVVDPPDGRIPLQPWAAARRNEIMANQDTLEHLDPRVKCLSAGLPRANTPVGYNSYQFLQVPGAVVILYEWNHLSRYIPLDGRPHVSQDIQLGMGDSRGHWDGHALVVDVTNFTDNVWPVGNGAPPEGAPASSITTGHGVFQTTALHVVERFTPVDAETIHYEATITDPNVFTQPWTIAWNAFTRAPADHILYEYACHEGNGRNIKLLTGHDFDGVVLKLAK